MYFTFLNTLNLCIETNNYTASHKKPDTTFNYFNMTTLPIHNIYSLFLVNRDLIQFSIKYGKKFLN